MRKAAFFDLFQSQLLGKKKKTHTHIMTEKRLISDAASRLMMVALHTYIESDHLAARTFQCEIFSTYRRITNNNGAIIAHFKVVAEARLEQKIFILYIKHHNVYKNARLMAVASRWCSMTMTWTGSTHQ